MLFRHRIFTAAPRRGADRSARSTRSLGNENYDECQHREDQRGVSRDRHPVVGDG